MLLCLQKTFPGGTERANGLVMLLSGYFPELYSCLGLVLCLIKQRKLMRDEVTLCHAVNRTQCAKERRKTEIRTELSEV